MPCHERIWEEVSDVHQQMLVIGCWHQLGLEYKGRYAQSIHGISAVLYPTSATGCLRVSTLHGIYDTNPTILSGSSNPLTRYSNSPSLQPSLETEVWIIQPFDWSLVLLISISFSPCDLVAGSLVAQDEHLKALIACTLRCLMIGDGKLSSLRWASAHFSCLHSKMPSY